MWLAVLNGSLAQQASAPAEIVVFNPPGPKKFVRTGKTITVENPWLNTTDAAIDVRDRFGLTLAPEHAGRYQCEVVWRRGKTYGVKFVQ